jgi:predicted outer membrane repeat protein
MSALRTAAIGLALWLASTAHADTVMNVLDSGPGSLRNAMATTPPGGTVDFAAGVTGTITLTTGQILIDKSLTIAGPGAKVLTVNGNAARIFNVTGPVSVAISGLTLTGGVASRGGAIASNATLVLDAIRFTGNSASEGGGALHVYRAPGGGASVTTIRRSTFDANSVPGSAGVGGGAILVAGIAATVSPAVPAQKAALTLVNTTVSGNLANGGPTSVGGGIVYSIADVVLVSSTVAFNRSGAPDAIASGANLHQGTAVDTTLTLRNAIVSDGQALAASVVNPLLDLFLPGGASLTSHGGSLLHHRPVSGAWQTSDLEAEAKLVAPLADYGGNTPTHRLDVASPAHGHVPKAACTEPDGVTPLATDQRGVPRGVDSCASGAYEPQAALALSPASRTFTLTRGLPFTQTFTASGGVPGYTYALANGTAPGLGFASSTLAGTPTTTGTFYLSIRASDSVGSVTADQIYAVVVRPPAVQMTLGTSNPSVPAGTGVTLTATVTGSSPTGTVAFRNGPATFAGCSAVALTGAGNTRTAQCATGALAVGSYTFTATYPGDANNAAGEASVAQTAAAIGADACAGFGDVAATNTFCPNVDWLRNRGITLGCGGGQYCPNGLVNRFAIAALLNRFGTAFIPLPIVGEDEVGVLDLDAAPPVCATAASQAANYPRRAQMDAVVMATAHLDVTMGVQLLASFDGGLTWQPVSALPHRSVVPGARWSNQRVIANADIPAGVAPRFAIGLGRDGLVEAVDLAGMRCVLRARLENRNETFSPYDTAE